MKPKRHSLLHVLRHPAEPEVRRGLQARWAELPNPMRTAHQLLGRTELGCGATVGVMPRCDFACQACYLGDGANQIPPLPLKAVKQQMQELRSYLGPGGNLQLTDGEVTLRPAEELIELLQAARELGLIPMLMTHGDTFRRRPELLSRLVVEGGLQELSIHIDVTQRGRMGSNYKHADSEHCLMPLREEFAQLIRTVRKETRRPLRVASSITVTRDNLDDIPELVRWFASNSDVFRMLSFQPVAQVGRTVGEANDGVDVDALWTNIGAGLLPAQQANDLHDNCWWMGHSACNRILTGFVVIRPVRRRKEKRAALHNSPVPENGESNVLFHPLTTAAGPLDKRFLSQFIDRFGGVRFRASSRMEAATRVLAMILSAPCLMAWIFPRYALRWLRRIAPKEIFRFVRQLVGRRARMNRFTVVSHHFMSRDEIENPIGQERLEHCVFRIPVNDRLMSMCEFNANGHREEFYRLTEESEASSQ